MNYAVGERIGDYEIIGILGAGGMGRVYKVRNIISERIEALKILLPNLEADPGLGERFLREIKVQAALQHPNIAALHTALRLGNQLVMLIEYLDGQTIEQMLERGPLPVEEAAKAVGQVLQALSYAHGRGVIHRDIKPANIMILPDGTAKLMDFGIAFLKADRKLTQTGRTVGSLYYMSPEQIQGAAIDARSDIYSLGVTLYQMVTGQRPFQGDSDYSVMAAHLSSDPVPPLEVDPKLPAAINDVILTAIARDPSRRFQSAEAFRTAITGISSTPPRQPRSAAGPAPIYSPPSIPQPVQRTGVRGMYVVAGSLATVAALVLMAWQGPRFLRSEAQGTPAETSPRVAPAKDTPEETAPENSPKPVAEQQTAPVPAFRQAPAPSPISQTASATPPEGAAGVSGRGQTRTPPPAAESEAAEDSEPQRPQRPPAPTADAMAPAGDTAAGDEIRELLIQIGARAVAATASLDSVRAQQSAMGVNLRRDVAAAEAQMQSHLQASEAAIQAQDFGKAKKSLAAAERALEAVERFLGR